VRQAWLCALLYGAAAYTAACTACLMLQVQKHVECIYSNFGYLMFPCLWHALHVTCELLHQVGLHL
jgi:hypothetical protein